MTIFDHVGAKKPFLGRTSESFSDLTEGLPGRCVAALYQVFTSRRLRRGTYQADEDLSLGQATRDLRELARLDWLKPYGETKGRFYAPGPKMMEIRADFAARAVPLSDPYRAVARGRRGQ